MIDQYSSLTEKFLKKGFWLYLFSFIIAPIGYIIKIIISGDLSVSELGILYGVVSLIVLLSSFNDFGMTDSMSFFIPKYLEKKEYNKIKTIILMAFITQIITGLCIALFMFFGADFLAEKYFKSESSKEIIQLFCLYFLGINIFQVFNNFFMTVQNTLYNRITEFLRMLFILGCVVSFSIFNIGDLWSYALAWILGLYFGIVFVVYLFYKKYYKNYLASAKIDISKSMLQQVFSYAILIFLASQSSTILSQMDMQMIIFFLGTSEAGYYTNYLSIITIPFILLGPILGFLFPVFSELHSTNDFNKIKKIKEVMLKNFIAISIAFNVLFFVFAEVIALVLFGEKFIESGNILKFSILFLVFNFMLQINFNILAGIGKAKERLRIIISAIFFNFIMNIILINGYYIIPAMGTYGAAFATALGWILIWLLSEISLGKKYYIPFQYKFFTKNLILLGILGYFAYSMVAPILLSYERGIALIYMCMIGIVWFTLFISMNIKEYKLFIVEFKKLKYK